MKPADKDSPRQSLPVCATEYIARVTSMVRYRRRARAEVTAELTAHFEDALSNCEGLEQREAKARELIAQFGDPKLLAILCRRAKKRCRPLWKKTLIRAAQVLGVILIYLAFCLGRLLVGSPRVKTNYVTRFNEQVRQGREASLNARPYFDEAARLAEKRASVNDVLPGSQSRWPGDMNDAQRMAVADLLEANAAAFETLRQGAMKPYCWADYLPEGPAAAQPRADQGTTSTMPSALMVGNPFVPTIQGAVLSSLSGCRELAFKSLLRAQWRAWKGDLDGAYDDCLLVYRLAWHLEGKGLMAEQLVGVAIEALAHSTAWTILGKTEVPAAVLERFQRQLEEGYCSQDAILDFEADRFFWYDLIQRTFTDNGEGGGRPLKAALGLVAPDLETGAIDLVTFGYPDRREMTQQVDGVYDALESLLRQTPSQAQQDEAANRLKEAASGSYLLSLEVPAYARLVRQAWALRTSRRALVVILATLRYEQDHGPWPDHLDVLFGEGYLSEIPIDPYSGRPFAYRKRADGFLLYSWGEDFKDGGGRQGTNSNGQPRLWQDNGDWVFWPRSE